MPILNSCCFRLSLEVGAIVLGSLGFATSGVSILNLLLITKLSIREVFLILLHFTFMCLSFCLVLATQLRKAKLVIPWLIGHLVIVITICCYTGYYAYYSEYWPAHVCLIIIILLTGVYFWLCGFSYYQELKSPISSIL